MQLTKELEQLQRRIPVVGDRALIDLVKGIQVNKGLISYRKNQGFFGKLLDKLGGNNEKRQELLNDNLVAGQDTFRQWVLELSDSLRISQVALRVTRQELLETGNTIRISRGEHGELIETLKHLEQRINQHEGRIDDHEKRLFYLEVKGKLTEIVKAWTNRSTYTQLPWAVQVPLLVWEVFSNSVTMYELKSDARDFRKELVEEILTSEQSKQLPENFFALSKLLELSLSPAEITNDNRELAVWLLEVSSVPEPFWEKTPYLFVIGKTLELSMLPDKPENPAEKAIATYRRDIGLISPATDKRKFVEAVVEETADYCLEIIKKTEIS
ncbi:hypothetical protein [Mastigocladopsis repens]|uniref:hypothetical protein n=1 Tax=Mastigocladopsis repens TaxID=221287 RepID=UPI000309CD3E|nr:hypothetical protein [Mastigocladopsis repens]